MAASYSDEVAGLIRQRFGKKMNTKEILELIKTGEGYTVEFKEALSGSIGKEICAFANASGGRIILGAGDNGSIKGFILKNSDISKIHDIARNMDPSLNIVVEKSEELAVIYVPEGKDKPYTVSGHFYLRVGANSQQLKRDEIRLFFQRENQIFFDRKSNIDFDMKYDFNNRKFKEYINKANISKNLAKTHILKNMNALTGRHINNAGVLFFCNKATKFFTNASIVCVLYKGTERVDILDKKEFNADLISNFNDAHDYIVSKLNTNYIIKGKERINKLELPEEALREAIINAMVHRNYFSQGHIQIDIFLRQS